MSPVYQRTGKMGPPRGRTRLDVLLDPLGLNVDASLGKPLDHLIKPLSSSPGKSREIVGQGLVRRIEAVSEHVDGLPVDVDTQLDTVH
jgi:hypothetical protein